MAEKVFTHTGMTESNQEGKRRTPLFKSGKYWVSASGRKFDHKGHCFGPFSDTLNLKSIKPIK